MPSPLNLFNSPHLHSRSPSLPFSPSPSPSSSPIPAYPQSLSMFTGGVQFQGLSQRSSPLALFPSSPAGQLDNSASLTSLHRPLKRQRTSSHDVNRGFSPSMWSKERRDRFDVFMARITASCGFPYTWVENPEVLGFMNEFIPAAQPVRRWRLANKLITAEVAKYRASAIEKCRGCLVTLQCDGWSGINFHHFVVFMIKTNKWEVSSTICVCVRIFNLPYQVYTVEVYNTSSESKTAINLFEMIKKVHKKLENKCFVTVIALVSDGSGETKLLRKMAVNADRSLITPDCFAHQVSDYFFLWTLCWFRY